MSGRKQHFIPQALLRGFAIAGATTRLPKVWVFPAGRPVFAAGVDGAAAQRNFYSTISTDGTATLDDMITQYEGDRLAKLIAEVRGAKPNSPVPSAIARECIGHLALRNAHLRASFERAFGGVTDGALELLLDQGSARRLLGLDASRPSAAFRRSFQDRGKDFAQMITGGGLPEELVEYIAFVNAKENFEDAHATMAPAMKQALSSLISTISGVVRDGHNKLLSHTLFPDAMLKNFPFDNWRVVRSDLELVLPDCVAIILDDAGDPGPMFFGDIGAAATVAMPVSKDLLLVGGEDINTERYNGLAASCSHSFFVSAVNDESMSGLHANIGLRALSAIDELTRATLSRAKQDRLGDSDISLDADFAYRTAATDPLNPLHSFDVHFFDIGDQAFCEAVALSLKETVADVAALWPLDRLDGVTFAIDYERALAELDRGFEASRPLTTVDPAFGYGLGRWPPVMRDGQLKVRIVARVDVAALLVSHDADEKAEAAYFALNALSHVAYVDILEASVPGLILGRISDEFVGATFDACCSAFEGYFACRHSIVARPEQLERQVELLEIACAEGARRVTEVLHAHWQHEDYNLVGDTAFDNGTHILSLLSQIIGSFDGLGQDFAEHGNLEAVLSTYRLHKWAKALRLDLRDLWDTFGEWSGPESLAKLTWHVDRAMWGFSVLIWKNGEGARTVFAPIKPS